MPFRSGKQRRYLWANEPEIARDWTDRYGAAGGGIMRLGYLHGGVTHPDGRRGFFAGAERDARAGKGAMSPGTGMTGRGRGLGNARENAIRQNTIPTTHTTAPGTLSDPREKQDHFTQSWSGPKGWFGSGGYRNLNVAGDTSQGHKSRFGGLGGLLMGVFGGIPGKVMSMLSHINPGKLRGWNEQYGRYNTQDEYEDARTKRQNRSRIDRLRKTRDYGKYANDPEGWAASDLSGRLTGLEKGVFGKDYVDYGRNRLQARDLKALRDQQALTSQLSTKSPVDNYNYNNMAMMEIANNPALSRYKKPQGIASINNQWSRPQIQQAKTYGLQDLKNLGAGYEGWFESTQDPNKQLQAIQDYYDAATKYKSSGLGSTQTPAEVRDYVERMGKTFMSGVPEIDMGMVPQDFLSEDIDFTNQKSPLSYEWDI